MNTNNSTRTALMLLGIAYIADTAILVTELLQNADYNRLKMFALPFVLVGTYMMIQGRKIEKDQYAKLALFLALADGLFLIFAIIAFFLQ